MKRRTKKTWKILATLSLIFWQFAGFVPAVLASEVDHPTSPVPTAPLVGDEVTPEVAPETTPEVAPETTPEVAPETTPEVAPETTPEVAPETTPEVVPETTPEVVPETTPEVVPETTPDKQNPDADLLVANMPTLTVVSIDQTAITTPQTLTLTAAFTDVDETFTVTGYYYGSEGIFKDLTFTYNSSDGIFEAPVEITQYERNQTFELIALNVMSGEGDTVIFYNQNYPEWFYEGIPTDFTDVMFTYNNPVTDVEPPEIEWYNLTVEPKVVAGNQAITLTVPATDASPITSAYIDYLGADKFTTYSAEFTLNPITQLYEATLLIGPYEQSQVLEAMQLSFSDAYWNTNTLVDLDAPDWQEGDRVDLSFADFEVVNPEADTTPPTADLSTVRVELDSDNRPYLRFSVADTQSGVQFVEALYKTTNGTFGVSGEVDNGEAFIYLPIDPYLPTQTITLEAIFVIDMQYNSQEYTREQGLIGGDYEYIQDESLITIPLLDLMYFDQNQNGQFDPDEKPTQLFTQGLYLEDLNNPEQRYYFVLEGQTEIDYTGQALIVNVPNGTYRLNMENYGWTSGMVITPGLVEITGGEQPETRIAEAENGQVLTVIERLGIYQAGMRVEISNSLIFEDANSNGIFDEGENYRFPIYEDSDPTTAMSNRAMGMPIYENLFVENEAGVRYGIAGVGKPGAGTNAYVYDLETGMPAFLPYGTYTVITTNPEEEITTPNTMTISRENQYQLVILLDAIGIGPKRMPTTNQAPAFTGITAVTLTVGTSFDSRNGVQAIDPEDGSIDFSVSGSVDINAVGTYTLTYSATDSQGLTTSVERTITVLAAGQSPTSSPTKVTTTGTVTTTLTNTGDQMLAMTLIAGFSSAVAGLFVIRRRK